MHIQVVSGCGNGPTELAAFDCALLAAGVANYNLIRLSSVIPAAATVSDAARDAVISGNWGDRLYVVMAEMRVHTPGAEAWAGLGWIQDRQTDQGLFVEHQGGSEHEVRASLQKSLTALAQTRHNDFGSHNIKVIGTICDQDPVCALVIAVYQAEGWGGSSATNRPHSRKKKE